MAGTLALGYGTITGTRVSPNTLYDSTTDGGRCNAYEIGNTDTANWIFAYEVSRSSMPPTVILPGTTGFIMAGNGGANNVTKVMGWATTPAEAGTASVLATGYPKKVG